MWARRRHPHRRLPPVQAHKPARPRPTRPPRLRRQRTARTRRCLRRARHGAPGVTAGPKAFAKSPVDATDSVVAAPRRGMTAGRAQGRRKRRGHDWGARLPRRIPGRDCDHGQRPGCRVDGEPASRTASEQGAGPLGFTGTTRTTATAPAGLVQVAVEVHEQYRPAAPHDVANRPRKSGTPIMRTLRNRGSKDPSRIPQGYAEWLMGHFLYQESRPNSDITRSRIKEV